MYIVFKVFLRSHAKKILDTLHRYRRRLLGRKKKNKRRRRRKRHLGKTPEYNRGPGAFELWAVNVREFAVKMVHSSVKRAQRGLAGSSETLRIFFNVCKVVSHLYFALSYCIAWPAALNNLLEIASVFALDLFAESKAPCVLTSFTYYDRMNIAMWGPLAMVALFALLGMLKAAQKKSRNRTRRGVAASRSTEDHRALGIHESVFMKGLWYAAPYALYIIDLIHPTITRTLCSFLTSCRDLASAGWWLPVNVSQSTFSD